MTVRPGYGNEVLHLGQTSADLKAVLGRPKRRRSVGSLRQYWLYPEHHLQFIVSRRTGNLLTLFFDKDSGYFDEALSHATQDQVRSDFGEPSRETAGMYLLSGGYLDAFMAYDSGICFFFGEDHTLRRIAVTAPKRKVKRKPVTHAIAAQHHIAALRRPNL